MYKFFMHTLHEFYSSWPLRNRTQAIAGCISGLGKLIFNFTLMMGFFLVQETPEKYIILMNTFQENNLFLYFVHFIRNMEPGVLSNNNPNKNKSFVGK